MASRRQGKQHRGHFDPESQDLTLEEAANIIYGDPQMLEELDRKRVITRPVNLGEITIDPAIQVRVGGLDEETLEKYTQILLNGGEFSDPVELFRDDESGALILADGFHRCEATRQALERAERGAEIAPLRGKIYPGGREGALDHAEEANLRHGKALSNADKRAIFERRLKRGHEWAKLSDRQVAQVLGVSHATVGNWRRELEQEMTGKNFPVETKRKGADGREYNISNIRQSNEQRSQPPKPLKPSTRYVQDEWTQPGYDEGYLDYDEESPPDLSDEEIQQAEVYEDVTPAMTSGEQRPAATPEKSDDPVTTVPNPDIQTGNTIRLAMEQAAQDAVDDLKRLQQIDDIRTLYATGKVHLAQADRALWDLLREMDSAAGYVDTLRDRLAVMHQFGRPYDEVEPDDLNPSDTQG